MKTTVILLASLLTGCGTMYTHPYHSSQEQYERDFRACQMKYQAGHPSMMLVAAQNAHDCMVLEKGYVKAKK